MMRSYQTTNLRGVGVWTSEMVLIFSLLRKDVFPLGDIGVIRAVENSTTRVAKT